MLESSGLINLINKHGIEIIKNQKRCGALIRDYCKDAPEKHLNLLILSLEDKIANTIIETINDGSFEFKESRILDNLKNNHGISIEGAKWTLKTWLKALASNEIRIDLGGRKRIELVLISAGKFIMGSPASENGRSIDETHHAVTLTKSYYMGKYPVTQEQWEEVMESNPSKTKGARLPVTDVSWEDCQTFIKKLNNKTYGGFRLPTEAEWEYACRAGTKTAYSVGDMMRPTDANFSDSNIGKPVEVGSYLPNAYKLYEMHGNVFEWCEDWYGAYSLGSVTDPKGPVIGESRVVRGGSFYFNASDVRSSYRFYLSPTDQNLIVGFRLLRTK